MRIATSSSASEPLELVEIASPKLGPRDVRVRVRAIGVNPVDWKMRGGGPLRFAYTFIGPSGPFVTGVDFAGEVVEIGRKVAELAVGARVVGGTNFARGQHGSYADEVIARPDQCATLPDSVSFEQAACLPVAGVTAWRALTDFAHVDKKPGARVLVLGASGGVGLFALQLGKMLGATCFGVCSARNVELVSRFGHAIDYTAGDALAMAKGPFDLILNVVGTSNYDARRCRALLAPGGKHVLAVIAGADVPAIALFPNTRAILGEPTRATLEPLVEALAKGALEPIIEQRYPLRDAEAAHARSRGGKVVGKLLLIPD